MKIMKIVNAWVIKDWTGKTMFNGMEFATFDAGWDFLLENFSNDDDLGEFCVMREDKS